MATIDAKVSNVFKNTVKEHKSILEFRCLFLKKIYNIFFYI